ncbi:hypothetical protein EOPP23_06360 [Endozoicomonas sp. OPT23]|uniref:DUF4297 family anti-phage-associated protein n=1 Tax=Endozoicomonas sp. OPT23 TaxID=2072845 RepID=UPI00129BB5DB|nr:DUF4297 family anti-phage-associated protein [Endozoicomonas sp. OPT23]MRI32609.1 hypothetical protein [Endozoicomonas sp. OPT23]
MDRSAIDTIRGYCYQFDKSILEVLSLKNDTDSIEVEGIEDVDVKQDGEVSAVQCKYYEKTEYNHSVIAKPIRLMLEHFAKNRNLVGKYYLFGHYKSGQNKLPTEITIEFLKDKFLTYTKNKIKYQEYLILGLTDNDLEEFIGRLILDINAKSFDEQHGQVVEELVKNFSCTKEEAIHYYYNAAFSAITKLGCDHNNRIITKSEFINKLSKTKVLFNIWLYKFKGRKQYLTKLKSDLFSRSLNTQPYDRFFVIDISSSRSDSEVKDCIYSIQKSWSNLSKRTPSPYSPYLYIYGKEKEIVNSIKKQVYNEGLVFSDGYNFRGSNFCVNTIIEAKTDRSVFFQYIETEEDLLSAVRSAKSRVEIYQIFTNENELNLAIDENIKNTKIQVLNFEDIKDII